MGRPLVPMLAITNSQKLVQIVPVLEKKELGVVYMRILVLKKNGNRLELDILQDSTHSNKSGKHT